jgi:hypothetical protein
MVRCDPAAKRPFDLMDFPQFSWVERRNAVLRHEDAQLVPRVNAPRLGAGLDQRGFGGLVRLGHRRGYVFAAFAILLALTGNHPSDPSVS